jgi:pyridoxine kinase
MNILSIQSHVAFGHVGNAAATFPLQRLGVEVWPIHTVQFSNHTGYGSWKGRVFDADMIGEVMTGIEARGVLGECNGVLSGYMGSAEIGGAILDAVAAVRRANPAARYCCDPVVGDVGRGIFVREGIPEFMREKAVPAADIVTPNQFELDYLSGRTSGTLAGARDAVRAVHDLGPRTILVTSLHTGDTPEDCIDMLASDDHGTVLVRTPKLPLVINGAGDVVAALFFAHYLRSGDVGEALSRAASSIFGVLARTAEAGAREIQLVAAQEEIVRPARIFEARPIESPVRRTAVAGARAMASSAMPPVPDDVNGVAGVPSVFHVDRLDLSLAPRSWTFADENRSRIDTWFADMRRRKTALWNGRVFLMHRHVIEHGTIRGQFLETDYASFAAWKHWGCPQADVYDCFSAAAVETSDGAFLLGVMGTHTINAGRVYFPCGTPDPSDVAADGTIDFEHSVRRELLEETGLAASMFTPDPGWTMVVDGHLIALIKVLRARESAKALHQRILAFLEREQKPELADIRIAYGPADFDPAMPRFVTAFLASRFAAQPLRAARG